MTGREPSWPDDGQKRQWWTKGPSGHVQKKPVRELAEGEEIFTIAEVESMGFIGVKKFAADNGLLREGRYLVPGRSKIKRMNYVDAAGLRLVIAEFRAAQGKREVDAMESKLAKLGASKERALKRLKEARGEL